MFCRKCGTKLEDNAKFCYSCGTPIAQAAETQTARQQAPENQPTQVVQQANTPTQQPQQQNLQQQQNQQPMINQQAAPTQTVYQQPVMYPNNPQVAPVQPAAPKAKKPFFKKVPVLISLAVIVVAAATFGIIMLVSNTSSEAKIKDALSKSFDLVLNYDSPQNEKIGLGSIFKDITKKATKHNITINQSNEKIDATIYADMDDKKFKLELEPQVRDLPISSIDLYADAENIMVGCKDIADDYIYMNFKDFEKNFENSNIARYLKMFAGLSGNNNASGVSGIATLTSSISQSIELIDGLLDELTDGVNKNWDLFLDKITYESIDSKNFKIGSKSIDCNGYQIIIKSSDVVDFVKSLGQVLVNSQKLRDIASLASTLDRSVEVELNELEREIDKMAIEMGQCLPNDIVISMYLNDGYVVNIASDINLIIGRDIETISLNYKALGENNPFDDFNCSLEISEAGDDYSRKLNVSFKNQSKKTDSKQRYDLAIETKSVYGFSDGLYATIEYDTNTDEFYIEFSSDTPVQYDYDYDYDEFDYYREDFYRTYYIQGRFSAIDKGKSFTVEITDSNCLPFYFEERNDGIKYTVEVINEVEPFVSFSDAKNILDIDEKFIMDVISKITRLVR